MFGSPQMKDIYPSSDPLHNYDTITITYNEGLYLTYDDWKDGIILKIASTIEECWLMPEKIIPGITAYEYIFLHYGEADYEIQGEDDYMYYQYFIMSEDVYPNFLVLQFKINADGICEGIVFQQDDM